MSRTGPLLVAGAIIAGGSLSFPPVREAGAKGDDMSYSGAASCSDCHGAFHRGGVARCNGCHTMHNSQGNTKMTYNQGGSIGSGFPRLLRAADSSSVCLYCHHNASNSREEYTDIIVSNPATPVGPQSLTPGGNFGWLKKSYSWAGGSSPGDTHGHNIVARDFGYTADGRLSQAPGGTYAASGLSCISCHDPHGRYRRLADGSEVLEGPRIQVSGSKGQQPADGNAVGSYRLLAGAGYRTSLAPDHSFVSRSPAAVLPSYEWEDDGDLGITPTVNRSEAVTDTRVAYGQGMSEWCANCHDLFHNSGDGSNLRHPAGRGGILGAAVAANYNAYVKTGDMSGSSDTAYSSLTPFEEGHAGYDLLRSSAAGSLAGPDPSANVHCLTCHRAHASGWDSIGRWNFHTTFLTVGGEWPGSDGGAEPQYHQGRTRAETRLAYYDRPANRFAAWQRSLCSKCHAKD